MEERNYPHLIYGMEQASWDRGAEDDRQFMILYHALDMAVEVEPPSVSRGSPVTDGGGPYLPGAANLRRAWWGATHRGQ